MATAAIYCTHKELKRVFPQIDSFDGKKQIYGWEASVTNEIDSQIDMYYANNTGLVSQLFADGHEVPMTAFNTTATTTLDDDEDDDSTLISVADDSAFAINDIIKINNEYMLVSSVSGSGVISIKDRGVFGTSMTSHSSGDNVYKITDTGDYATDDGDNELSFFYAVYDSDLDKVLLLATTNPNDLLMEAGEDFATLVTQFRTDASRYLDSMLDPNMPKEALKDKEGNFDYIIIRSSALIAANFMIKSHDPNSELANALMEEANNNIKNINDGKAALSWQVTRDSSQGVIRDVLYTAGQIRPVDTRGEWTGTYDLVKVKITTAGGVLGTAKYSVTVKGSTKLKETDVVTDEIITGDYQALAGGLQIRFAGSTDSSTATLNNEWEIEVFGKHETVDASSGRAVKMTRTRKI
mgnify:CR=1 FL=1